MCLDWTIDAQILYKYREFDLRAQEFLSRIKRLGHYIVLDDEDYIKGEYTECIRTSSYEARKALSEWFRRMRKRSFSACLSNRCKRELRLLKFDDDDVPYVGVCSKSCEKKLVSEDSDYTPQVAEYLETLGIGRLSIDDSLAIIDS
jgi:predicted nucleic acid-binding protein